MKKIVFIFMLLVVFSVSVYADDNFVNFKWEGKEIEFDTHPQIINDHTMLPMRALLEAAGFTVTWNDATKTANCTTSKGDFFDVTLNSVVIHGFDAATKSTKDITMNVPLTNKNGRILISVRTLEELLPNVEVSWDDRTRTAIVKDKNQSETVTTELVKVETAKSGIASYPYYICDFNVPNYVLEHVDKEFSELPPQVIQDLIDKHVTITLTNNGAKYGSPDGKNVFDGPKTYVIGDNGPEYVLFLGDATSCKIVLTYEDYGNRYSGSCLLLTNRVRESWVFLCDIENDPYEWKNFIPVTLE